MRCLHKVPEIDPLWKSGLVPGDVRYNNQRKPPYSFDHSTSRPDPMVVKTVAVDVWLCICHRVARMDGLIVVGTVQHGVCVFEGHIAPVADTVNLLKRTRCENAFREGLLRPLGILDWTKSPFQVRLRYGHTRTAQALTKCSLTKLSRPASVKRNTKGTI